MILKDRKAGDQVPVEPSASGDFDSKKISQSESDSGLKGPGGASKAPHKQGQGQHKRHFFAKNRIMGADVAKSSQKSGERSMMRLIIKSYDSDFLDSTARFMCEILKKNDVKYSGPVPLPVSIRKFVVKSSPHVYKDARHRFEIRESTRMIEFPESASAVSALAGVDSIHPSVSVKIKRISVDDYSYNKGKVSN